MLQEYLTAASRMAEFCYDNPDIWDRFTDWMFESNYLDLSPDSHPDFYRRVPEFVLRLAEYAGSFPDAGE